MINVKKILVNLFIINFLILNTALKCSENSKKNTDNLLSIAIKVPVLQQIIAEYICDEWNLYKLIKEGAASITFLDNNKLAIGTFSNTLLIYDINSSEITQILKLSPTNLIRALKFMPNKKYLISAEGKENFYHEGDRKIKIWDISGKCIKTLTGHRKNILSLTYSPNEKYIASGTGGHDWEVKIWDIDTGLSTQTLTSKDEQDVNTIAFSPDGNYIFTGSWSGYFKIWDLKTGASTLISNERPRIIRSLNISPDQKNICVASDKSLKIFDITDLPNCKFLESANLKIQNIANATYSPDGKYIFISGGGDKASDYLGLIQILDRKTLTNITTFAAHSQLISSFSISGDGAYISHYGFPNEIKIWNQKSFELLRMPDIKEEKEQNKEDINGCCFIS